MEEVIQLIKKFVERNSNIIGFQWNPKLIPKLTINPYTEDHQERVRVPHYFLLVASIDESRVIGRAENARTLMVHLHKIIGDHLFQIDDAKEFKQTVITCKFYDEFGPLKNMIPNILSSVNRFVKQIANDDLIKYTLRFSKPNDMVKEISRYVERMGDPTKKWANAKAWMYMRWMVRPRPDLRIFDHFSPKDLFIPLTTDVARVAVSLRLIDRVWPLWWRDVERVTQFARRLFPEDPAKVDYPFFLLGRWLRGKDLNINVLLESLLRFDEFFKKTGFSILVTRERTGYSAECPALPGCVTQGEDEDEVLRNMEEAIASYLECAMKYNVKVE